MYFKYRPNLGKSLLKNVKNKKAAIMMNKGRCRSYN